MTTMTIAEALAELKTLRKRVEKKQEFCKDNLGYPDAMLDPLSKEGGCQAKVTAEVQAATDLMGRVVKLRCAIMRANLTNQVTVGGATMSVYEALVWRREVAEMEGTFWSALNQRVSEFRRWDREQAARVEPGKSCPQMVVVFPASEILANSERVTEAFGALDGQLSVINATKEITLD